MAKPKTEAVAKKAGARGENWPGLETPSIFGTIFDPAPTAAAATASGDEEQAAATGETKQKNSSAPADEDQLKEDEPSSLSWSLFGSGEPDLGQDLALGRPTLSPANVEPLKKAIARYEAINAAGGWPHCCACIWRDSGEAVAVPRKRLEIEGDLGKGDFRRHVFG